MTRSPDYKLFAVVMALVMIGIVVVYSASYPKAAALVEAQNAKAGAQLDSPAQLERAVAAQQRYLKRQVLWSVCGLACLLGAMLLPLDVLRGDTLKIASLLGSYALLFAVLFVGSTQGHGARRWLNLGPLVIQPSEVAKFGMCLYLAHAISAMRGQINHPTNLKRLACVLGLMLGLVYKEPHLGGTLVMFATAACVLYAGGLDLKWLGVALLAAGLLAGQSVARHPYQQERMMTWLHPEQYANEEGYQAVHCGTALARGGWAGRGLGRSLEKFYYLPECHTDSIVAVLGEEQGFLGCLTVLVLFLILGRRGLVIAEECPDEFGSLLATGLTAAITLQALFNFGVTSGLLPQTGVGMPFLSYGGSSLCFFLTAVGILLNLSRHGRRRRETAPEPLAEWSRTTDKYRRLAEGLD